MAATSATTHKPGVYVLTCSGVDLETTTFDAGVAMSSMRASAVHFANRVDTFTEAPILFT